MVDRRWTRRALFRVIGAGALAGVAGACSPPSSSPNPPSTPAPPAPTVVKISLTYAQYQDMPKNIMSCATCSFFQAPNACKVVNGVVSANGYCRLYAQVD